MTHEPGHPQPRSPSHEDNELVDLVHAVLVDPNLPTDLQMRLQDEIRGILQRAHEETGRPSAFEAHRATSAHGHAAGLLAAVLVDPNLHTDARMNIHHQIRELLDRTDGVHPGVAQRMRRH